MGRLFWKFFFFIWLAQLATIVGMATIFSLERQRDAANWQAMQERGFIHPGKIPPPPNFSPTPPTDRPPLPPRHHGDKPPPSPLPIIPLAVSALASLFFAALLAWYFAKPIRQLRNALGEAAKGNLDARLGSSMQRNDELADLGCEFDRMAGQLQSLMDGQRRLLHDVSHELRSPLARLQAAIGLLRQQPDKTISCIERIERESVRMDQLVGELLTLSRLEAGVTGRMDEEIAIDELLSIIVEDARFEAQNRNQQIDLQTENGINITGNAELLRRAIENVIRNAIAHTPKTSAIRIQAREHEKHCLITIEDEGPGVPESQLQTIFEPFFRYHTADSVSGHGLGLAIARRITEAHGGAIKASNQSTGGLRIQFSLPAQKL